MDSRELQRTDFFNIRETNILRRPPLSAGFVPRPCNVQRELSWSLICQDGDKDTPNRDLVSKIDSVIKRIVDYGQAATGKGFRLYVTGYAQFFNDQDPGCNTVTFARTANPNPDNKEHPMMTTDLRQDFNLMSVTLNSAIQEAVHQNSGSNVKYVDIDVLLGAGHRFCEPGVKEPDLDNPKLWFWHYPYDSNEENEMLTDPTIIYLNSVQQANVENMPWDQNSTLWTDYLDDFWSKVDENQLNQTFGGNATKQANFWPDFVGHRARVFHPQLAYHEAIYKEIADQYIADIGFNINPVTVLSAVSTSTSTPQPSFSPSPTSSPLPPPPAYDAGTCCFHLIERENCNPVTNNLYANITLRDNSEKVIYQTPASYFFNKGLGDPINDGNGTNVKGPLPSPLSITGEHENDYVQFTYGTLSWTSKKANGKAKCTNGGWDPRGGPGCDRNLLAADLPAENQMDCCFPC